ncbi:hypothetical protein LguiB_027081 [Lonicera macranthoides]
MPKTGNSRSAKVLSGSPWMVITFPSNGILIFWCKEEGSAPISCSHALPNSRLKLEGMSMI